MVVVAKKLFLPLGCDKLQNMVLEIFTPKEQELITLVEKSAGPLVRLTSQCVDDLDSQDIVERHKALALLGVVTPYIQELVNMLGNRIQVEDSLPQKTS